VWEGAAAQESGGGIPGAAGLWGAAGPHHRVRHDEGVRGQQPTEESGGHVHTAAASRVRPPTGATAGEELMLRVCMQAAGSKRVPGCFFEAGGMRPMGCLVSKRRSCKVRSFGMLVSHVKGCSRSSTPGSCQKDLLMFDEETVPPFHCGSASRFVAGACTIGPSSPRCPPAETEAGRTARPSGQPVGS
jgi:hypothetical protein